MKVDVARRVNNESDRIVMDILVAQKAGEKGQADDKVTCKREQGPEPWHAAGDEVATSSYPSHPDE